MNKYYKYLILPLLLVSLSALAQEEYTRTQMDSIVLGNLYRLCAGGNGVDDDALFQKSPEVDVAKALYGQYGGLLVKQGTGRSEENQAKLRLHGHSPLVLVDGFPRSLEDVSGIEIESVTVLKDAAAAALYGVKGANGAIVITTKRGTDDRLKVTAKYQYGLATAFRKPEFADSYTYAYFMNQARELDGLEPRYSQNELYAFKNNLYPYAYPNVDWQSEIYRSHGDNHRAQMTFTGGNRNFRYFAAMDYMKDDAMYRKFDTDDRYNSHIYDSRLSLRANVDVNITKTTAMKLGVQASLAEFNRPEWDSSIESIMYSLPSAAFPIRQEDGVYGGSSLYGAVNPVAQLESTGQHQYSRTKVVANLNLMQNLSVITPGLSADVAVAFDYLGQGTEYADKEYRYSELLNNLTYDGTDFSLDSTQKYYGVDSKTLEFSHRLNSLRMKFELQGRVNYERAFGKHSVGAHVAYRMRSWVENTRNASSKTQEILGTVSYNWNNRLMADVVVNYSGSAYLPKGSRFTLYPAVSLAGVILQGDPYIKAYGSFGLSGMDEDLTHELYRQVYGSDNAHGTRFGLDGVSSSSGKAEGDLAALTLKPELSTKGAFGFDMKFFKGRLGVIAEGFIEKRSNIFISTSNISEVIGIGVRDQSVGENRYKGIDLDLRWNDKAGDFNYGLYANGGWVFTKVVNDGQAFQQYDYLYHAGNPVGQCYGLEVIGIFQNQYEINNSPQQTFSEVRPGDLKYRDQNGDGVIDSQDVVKMFGSSSVPTFEFGFGLNLGYKGFKFFADFQGVTGLTVSLLNSPLYKPLVSNGTISETFLTREIPWTPENASAATMPRLTTLENSNNYRSNSLWYRDGSFLKLRNLGVSYTISRDLMKICDMTISLNGTNLFCADNIKFADPEQLGAYYPSTRCFWAGVKFNF